MRASNSLVRRRKRSQERMALPLVGVEFMSGRKRGCSSFRLGLGAASPCSPLLFRRELAVTFLASELPLLS